MSFVSVALMIDSFSLLTHFLSLILSPFWLLLRKYHAMCLMNMP